MISFKLRGLTKVFENSSIITKMIDRVTGKALRGFGAYVRAVARRSLGKGNAVSIPGEPPTSRTGFLKNSIQFGTEMRGRRVVIGPVKKQGWSKRVTTLVPPLLEYGGLTMMKRLGTSPNGRGGNRLARYRARPFMGPAFEKSLPKLPEIWQRAKMR